MERVRQWCQVRLEGPLGPLARGLHRLGVRPNQVTVAGVLLNLVAAGLIVADQLVAAGVVYLLAGSLDILDGMVARAANIASSFGAFLDSTLDRVSEGVVFSAIAYHFARSGDAPEAGLVVLALLGSVLVSYTRARAEALGAECRVGVVTRAERVIIIAVGLLFGILLPLIYVLVVLTAITVAQRILHIFVQLRPQQE